MSNEATMIVTNADGGGDTSKGPTSQDAAPVRNQILDFSNRKAVVYNVDKFLANNKAQTLVESWVKDHNPSIVIEKTKKPPKQNFITVTLASEDMVEPFLTIMNNVGPKAITNKKGTPLYAKRVNSNGMRGDNNDGEEGDRRGPKRSGDNFGENSNNKRAKFIPAPKTEDEVRDALTPLWKVPYEDQLKQKTTQMIKKCAVSIVKELRSTFRNRDKEAKRNKHTKKIPVFPWLDQKGAINIQDCIASPSIYEYRNKVEFTFGYLAPQPKLDSESAVVEKDNTKKVACVGMLASGWKGGISKPHGCSNTPSEACGVADVFNKFLKNCPMPPYDNWTHTGVWRQVTIRMSRRTNQCMLIIQHAPPTGAAGSKTDGSEDHTAVFESESKRLVRMLTKHSIRLPSAESRAMPADAASEAKTDMRVTSIYFQEYDGLSTPSPAHPVQHKYGSLCMEEKLGKCTFEISPGAFFQVNTPGAELLYGVVVEKLRELQPEKSSGEKHKTLLFDVCCGTGTIGLTCLKEGVADQVVGVDISEPAIADAVNNAKKNGIDAGETSGEDDTQMTTRFIASRAEAVLTKELSKARANKDVTTHIVAVVDPARDGLHPVVVRALGAQEDIKRIVYVSCNPVGTLVRDAAMLCAPPTKKYSGLPFKITSAQPVDMFPLTPHCEMVMTFDRMTQEEYNACLEEKPVEEAK